MNIYASFCGTLCWLKDTVLLVSIVISGSPAKGLLYSVYYISCTCFQDGKSGRTILHYAAESGNLSLLSFLLRYPQLDINASTYGGLTPIMLAKGRGHHSVVEVLKGAGAQYDSSDESIDEEMVSIIGPVKHG